jgi:diguanylate cyclase (GGDEF)-like protein
MDPGARDADDFPMSSIRRAVIVGPLVLACLVYLVVPQKSVAQMLLYLVVAGVALIAAIVGVRRHRPVRRRLWVALLGGMASWVMGEAVWTWEVWVAHRQPFPSVADAFFLAGYVLFGLALFWLVRGRQPGRDRAALIDASVVAIGVGVLVAVFVITPIAADFSQSVSGRIIGSLYPLGDLLLLGMLVRLSSTPGARTAAFWLLVTAMTASLVADAGYNFITLTSSGSSTPRWLDATWLACYVALAATALHPSMRELSEPAPEREERLSRRRLLGLAAASSLAPLTLLTQATLGQRPSSVIIGMGSLALSALVLTRMAGLLRQVRAQAVQLAALASVDGLTGIPNRRTWDLELSRACAAARDAGHPLAVGLLDLDHFKAYNDTYGHQAGDELLREAVVQWSSGLRPGDLLARYGGEEFAVLLPGCDAGSAVEVLERLRPLTPAGQTFSAGLALWNGERPSRAGMDAEEPAAALARADEALYEAKRNGRDQVRAWKIPPSLTGATSSPDASTGAKVLLGGGGAG